MTGDLLIFDGSTSLWEYTPSQAQLFPVMYHVDPGDTGIIVNEHKGEWVVLIGNALLVVEKCSNNIRILSEIQV